MRTWMIVAAACIVASAVGLLAAYAAIDHNPQEEFVNHATGAVNYRGLTEIFLSWFVVVSLVAGLALALLVWMYRGLRMLCQQVRRADRLL